MQDRGQLCARGASPGPREDAGHPAEAGPAPQPRPRRGGAPGLAPQAQPPLAFFQRAVKAGEANRFARAAGGHRQGGVLPGIPGSSEAADAPSLPGRREVRCASSGRDRSRARSAGRAPRPTPRSPGFAQHQLRVGPAPGEETGAGGVGVSALGGAALRADSTGRGQPGTAGQAGEGLCRVRR